MPFLSRAKDADLGDLATRGKLVLAMRSVGAMAAARKEALEILTRDPSQEDALLVLADTSATPEQLRSTEAELAKAEARPSAALHLARATIAGKRGDTTAAESAVRRAIETDPKSGAAHLALATLRLAQKDVAGAGAEFKMAAEVSPLRSIPRLKYAEYLAHQGMRDEARKSLAALTEKAPDYLPAWSALAQLKLAERNYAEALSLLDNVFRRDTANFDGRMLQGQIFLAKGDAKSAVECFDNLDKSYTGVPAVKFHLARAYLLSNNPAQATAALAQAIAADPNFAEAALLQGELNLRRGEAQAVVTAMLELLTRQPKLLPAQLLLADAYRTLGRLDEAAEICRAQIAAMPESSHPHFLLGSIQRQQGKFPEARASFEKSAGLGHDGFLTSYQLVELDLITQDFAGAMQRVEKQLKDTPKSAGAHFLQARIFAAEKKWDQAEAALLKTLEFDPNFVSAYDMLVSTYVAAGKLAQAIGQLEGMVALHPTSERPLMISALIHDRMQDFAKAAATYEKLLSHNANFAPALNNLAWLFAEHLGQLDRAHDLAKKARAIQPSDPAIADTLGWISYKRGDYPQALALLREAVARLPGEHEVQYHYGLATYMMGEMEAARTSLRLAAQAPGDFPGKSEIRDRLASLGDGSGGVKTPSITQFEQMAKAQPNDVVAQLQVGEFHEKQGDFTKAAATYEGVLKINAKLLPPTLKLAQLYAGPLNDPGKAMDYAKKARALAPNDPKATGLLGKIAYRTGNAAWAYGLLQESARQLADDATVQQALAATAYGLGKVDEARQVMERVAGIAAPDSPEAAEARRFLELTALAQDPARLAEAEPAVQKALASDPAYLPALVVRAALEAQRQDAKAAAATYAEVLRRHPDFTPAQRQLAILYAASTADRPAAYDLAAKARKALPADAELAQLLAELSYDRKDYAYARQLLRESEGRRPLGARQLYYLGMACWHTREKAASQDALKRALEAGLAEPLAAEARRALEQQARE
jgi:tetratricopeptide (TPR) repeat protein